MRHGVQDLVTAMAVVESLVEYKRGDFSKPKPQSRGNHAKDGGDKESWGYTPKKWSSKGPSGKDGKGKNKKKDFSLRPIVSYVIVHTGHQTAPREKP